MRPLTRLALALLAFVLARPSAPEAAPPAASRPIERETKEVEGWKVRVDTRLLGGPDAELGAAALRVLGFKLYEISRLVPADRLAELRKTEIVLDLDCPRLNSMQYHPSARWLDENGHDPSLAKAVHIPHARELTSRLPLDQQPMVILHELAHAYHDRVLGFDEPRIRAAWLRYKEGGKGDKVLHVSGRTIEHYALTNQMEFFAEMTEAYFGTNDFYPFVRAELRRELPDVYELLEDVWGKSP